MAVLTPLASPAFHRPLRDPQRGSDLPVLLPALEASHGLEPNSLPRSPLGVGQATTLRISHRTRTTEATCALSEVQPDITRSSSVVLHGSCCDGWAGGSLACPWVTDLRCRCLLGRRGVLPECEARNVGWTAARSAAFPAEGSERPAGPCRRPHLLAEAQRPHLTQRILCHTYGQRRVGCAVGDFLCACLYSVESAFEKVQVCGGCLWGG